MSVMDGWELDGAKGKDKSSSHRDFSTMIRPLMWFGVLIGVIPCTAHRLPDGEAEEGKPRVTYSFSVVSFPSFITVVWWFTTVLYALTVPFDDPFLGKEHYSFLAILNYIVGFIYVINYVPVWIILWRAARLTSLFNAVAELDAALPSRSLKTCLTIAVSITSYATAITMSCLFEKFVDGQKNIIPRVTVFVHVSYAGPTYVMLMWTLAVHLAQKFEVLNTQVEEAVKWKNAAKLSHLRHLHYKLRSVVKEVDAVFYPVTGPSYIRMIVMMCMQLTLVDTYSNMDYSPQYFWIFVVMNCGYMINIMMVHALPDLCAGKAASTVHLLEAHDPEDDAFSKQVSRWRAELASTRVYITASGLVELNMPGLWTTGRTHCPRWT
ncbi:uncharacterized protein LOC123518978 isoform X2 [Portunus trituberculatus]|uniref:uncharacterized protein LOC123518978 isoform X2 n=1 Tax=Portunus trituberculatus TaxID=210409 RepID=UPI001E1D1BDA|nr:uncharacterized protein LOC123518978 isoform X2 [Portunus trituberculatus]